MISPDTELRIPIDDILGDISVFRQTVMDLPLQGRTISRLSFEPNPEVRGKGVAVIQTTTDNPNPDRPFAIFQGINEVDYERRSGI